MLKTDLRVGDVMTVGVITLPADKTVQDAARLIKRTKVGSIIVTKGGKAEGILTERDIVCKVNADGKNSASVKVGEIMSRPLRVISASESIQSAALALKENKVKRLPVIDKREKLVGIITEGDLVRAYPGLIDVILEAQELARFSGEDTFTGICEVCGMHSEDLKREGRKLMCGDCREEEEA